MRSWIGTKFVAGVSAPEKISRSSICIALTYFHNILLLLTPFKVCELEYPKQKMNKLPLKALAIQIVGNA
jgi:hypothetical protein